MVTLDEVPSCDRWPITGRMAQEVKEIAQIDPGEIWPGARWTGVSRPDGGISPETNHPVRMQLIGWPMPVLFHMPG
jgi:hypothetical protein